MTKSLRYLPVAFGVAACLAILLTGCAARQDLRHSASTPPPLPSVTAQIPTNTPAPTPTATRVPVFTGISCKPSSNPFESVRHQNPIEYTSSMLPNIEIARKCSFSGEVARGANYEHQILPDLVFCLVPGGLDARVPDEGWTIIITEPVPPGCNAAAIDFVNFGPIVTPPWRSNPLFDIHGWHFRNADNSGPNDGSVNVAEYDRIFNFVFNTSDYFAAWYAVRCDSWGGPEDCARSRQNPFLPNTPHSTIRFTITNLQLSNLVPGGSALIERMAFTVDVYLPAK